MKKIKFVIWGAGLRGRRLLAVLNDWVVAFVDCDENKVGKDISGIKIIDFNTYLNHYSDCFIIVSMANDIPLLAYFKQIGFYRFFSLKAAASEIATFDSQRLWFDLPINLKEGSNVAVFGCELTGVLWYEFLRRKEHIRVTLVAHKGDDCRLNELKNLEYDIIDISEIEERCIDVVVWTMPILCDKSIYLSGIKKSLQNKYSLVDVYNLRESFPNLFFEKKIEKFAKYHKEDRCFVIGNGPSLKIEDLDALHAHNEISIGVNAIYKVFTKTAWRPTYYMAVDAVTYVANLNGLLGIPAKAKFYGQCHDVGNNVEQAIEKLLLQENAYSFHWQRIPGVSEDFSRGAYVLGTVLEICLQLMMYMGFKSIYIIGADFDYTPTKENPVIHFTDDYLREYFAISGKQKNLIASKIFFDTESVAYSYDLIRLYAESRDIKIYNATRGGKLEVFERTDFDGLFK